MTDIALVQDSYFANFDIFTDGAGFWTDDGLQTAVTISLFTDKRLPDGVEHPDGMSDRRGYWGDIAEQDGYEWGSLLWTLYRSKITNQIITNCREYAVDALKWMIDDGIAESVVVNAERGGTYQINIEVVITKRDTRETLRYSYLWDGEASDKNRTFEGIEVLDALPWIDKWYQTMNFTVPGRFS